MRYIHKTLLLISLLMVAACVLQGCSSDSPDIVPAEEHQAMKFATAGVSRALTTNLNYAGSRFALFGDVKNTTNGRPINVFNNTEVEYDGNAWTYDGTQYWLPKYEHSFVAVYPSEAIKITDEAQYAESKVSFTYAIPISDGELLDHAGNLDLLAATHRRKYDADTGATVSLKFAHLMSLVNLAPAFADNLMGDDDYILLHGLKFSGINTKARFDIIPAPRQTDIQTDDMVLDVIAQQNGNPGIVLNPPVMIKNHAENVSLLAHNDAIIMLPQTFAADSEAKIILSFSINEETTIRQVDLPLNNLKWESGSSYTCKFTIDRSGLEFDKCEINPWNEIKGDDITVD